jgi:hypothetical protein
VDALFELCDSVLCAEGAVCSLVGLSLAPEHRRGHGALYDAVNAGRVQIDRLRRELAGLPLPPDSGGRIVLGVDVSNWLRPDAVTAPQRSFCHVYGRGHSAAQLIPDWPYSFVAALEPGRTSWTAVLDVVRLGPLDEVTEVTAAQVRAVVDRLRLAGQWTEADQPIRAEPPLTPPAAATPTPLRECTNKPWRPAGRTVRRPYQRQPNTCRTQPHPRDRHDRARQPGQHHR